MKRNDISFGNSNERKVLEYLNNNNSDIIIKQKGDFVIMISIIQHILQS